MFYQKDYFIYTTTLPPGIIISYQERMFRGISQLELEQMKKNDCAEKQKEPS